MTAALHRWNMIGGATPVVPAEDPPPAALELFAAILRRKGLVLAIALASAILAGTVLSAIPDRYEATAEVLVERSAPRVLAFEEVAAAPEIDDASQGSEVRMILAPEIFAQAVDRLRLAEDPEFNPDSVPAPDGLVADLKARLKDALGWRAPVAHVDAAAGARAARALAIRNLRRATMAFPLEKSRVVAVRVSSRRPEKAALIANALVDLHLRSRLEERRGAAARAVDWLETRLRNVTAEAREAAARAEAYRAKEATTATLSSEAAAALLRDLTGALAKARADGRLRRAATLERAASDLRVELARIMGIEAELARLDEDAEAATAIRSTFRTRLAETRAQAGVQQLDARIVARATAPLSPAAPNAAMILALALAGGLTLGGGLAALADSRHAPFRTVRQVETGLGLPVLAIAPRAPGLRKRPLRHVRRRPGSRLAEAVRELRGVFDRPRQGESGGPKVVAIASARPGEGKSTLAALLAESCVRAGWRTLLIDCDLRRSSVAALYDLGGADDLVDVLAGDATLEEAALRDAETGLFVLTAQPSPAARSDLFVAPAFADLVEEARAKFDAVVIDTPPALALADARLAAAAADATILAVRWADTPKEEAASALRLLQDAGARVAGVALTLSGRGADHRIDIASGGPRYGRFAEYFAD